ncbi:hypothetical protein FRC03_001358 [Tulasnella sp. 419]|nr:hypothetical protein FRC03_001358 [Tulasnella sp. 419]
MASIENIPRFRGDGTEDADGWLRNLLAATGHFNDSGILRFLSAQLENGSPAREWYDNLEEDQRSLWSSFERAFRSRWTTAPQAFPSPPPPDSAWEAFKKHSLSYEHLIESRVLAAAESTSGGDTNQIVSHWIEEHLAMGRSTDRDDNVLMQTTKALVPGFIRAHLEVMDHPQPSSFEELCTVISVISPGAITFERARRREASEEWRERMERQIQDISNKVETLLSLTLSAGGGPSAITVGNGMTQGGYPPDPAASINWEPSSPLTSIMSLSQEQISEAVTPVMRLESLPTEPDEISTQEPVAETEVPESLRVPLSWRKPVVTLRKEEIVTFAHRLVNRMALFPIKRSKYDELAQGPILLPQQCEAFASGIAICDNVAKSTIFYNKFTEILHECRLTWLLKSSEVHEAYLMKSSEVHEAYSNEQLGWRGYAMICGYRTYQHPSLIAGAVSCWIELEKRTIQQSQTSHGRSQLVIEPSRRPTYVGYVAAGDYNNPYLDQTDTLLKLTLSAYLAERTQYEKYKETAQSLVKAIKSTILDSATMLVKDGYIPAGASKLYAEKLEPSCHLTGLFIEGLSVLASVTDDHNLVNLMVQVATAAIHTSQWHGSDGILNFGSDGDISTNLNHRVLKGFLLRGLLEAYQRTTSNAAFRDLIRSYINVQFNALRDLAREGDNYGVDWRGPFKGPFLHAQLAAFDALVAAIGVQ